MTIKNDYDVGALEHTVERVLSRRGWELVDDLQSFVDEVGVEVAVRLPGNRRTLGKVTEDAVINRYGPIWYAACRGDDKLRQYRAFQELYSYLYPKALYTSYNNPDIALEATQASLVKIWESLDHVRDPRRFAGYATVVLVREVNKRFKVQQAMELPLEQIDDEEGRQEIADPRAEGLNEPDPVMTLEIRDKIEQAILTCLSNQAQQKIIIRLYLDGKGFREVIEELGLKPSQVAVLKVRALAKLRKCDEFLNAIQLLL